MPVSEPAHANQPAAHGPLGAYSEDPAAPQNRAAQAGHAAAHNAEVDQTMSSKGKHLDEANLAKLIAEENTTKSKFARYPGLERWELLEKMGDGAFSNVYRAKDLQGEYSEVGIKVVRKYEMNSMQVSFKRARLPPALLFSFSLCFCSLYFTLPTVGGTIPLIGQQTFTSGLQKSSESCRGAR